MPLSPCYFALKSEQLVELFLIKTLHCLKAVIKELISS